MSLEQTITELNANLRELITLIRQTNDVAQGSWGSLVPPNASERKEIEASSDPKQEQAKDAPAAKAEAAKALTHEEVRSIAKAYFAKGAGNSAKLKEYLSANGIVSITACPQDKLASVVAFMEGGHP